MTPAGAVEIRLRDAEPLDLLPIVAIYNATISSLMSTADLRPVTVASRRQWFEEHTPSRRPLWVAERQSRVVGWLSFQDFYGRMAYEHTAELSVYVDPDARRAGIGKLLLRQALGKAHDIGLERLVAFIFGHNTPSFRLFESAGFQLWGTMPGVARLGERQADLLILGRAVHAHVQRGTATNGSPGPHPTTPTPEDHSAD